MAPDAASAGYDPKAYRLLSFHDAVSQFRDGTDTPRAYLERCLAVIAARDADIKAFAFLNADAARKAADAATERHRLNRPLSLVDGMPIGIKDLMETADMPTEYGCELFRGNQPIRDAAGVYALRKGGAVLVGKTVTVCLGGGDPSPTRNPFDTRRTPGGSSSGSAASVAARMLPVGLGTHARGSTIRPASFCGVFAIKPTFGAINRQGVFSAAHSMDHFGILAGSLSDMWIVARYTSEHAGGDPGHPGLYGGALPPAPHRPRAPHSPRHGRVEGDGYGNERGVRGLSRGLEPRRRGHSLAPGRPGDRRPMSASLPPCRSCGGPFTVSRCAGRFIPISTTMRASCRRG